MNCTRDHALQAEWADFRECYINACRADKQRVIHHVLAGSGTHSYNLLEMELKTEQGLWPWSK